LQPDRPADGFVGTVEDVTARRELDAALAERSAELARSNEDLERFAYVASHDLQEPLRMVNSYGQLLLRRHGPGLLPEAQEFLHFMVDGGQRAQALIRDLLTLAQVDSTNQAQRRPPVALDAVLADALYALRDRMRASGATVTHDPLPTVRADAAQMGQLLDNLLSNALKFRGPAAPVIHIGAERQGATWRISVSDNGIGVDPKYFDRIFVMFQRLHLRSEHEGTGIGLAICKKVVERHGGQIGLASQSGQGATFFFTLPDPKLDTAP
jgi:light-regulated signal transduction histidine kinase (bacteriophytochrome)